MVHGAWLFNPIEVPTAHQKIKVFRPLSPLNADRDPNVCIYMLDQRYDNDFTSWFKDELIAEKEKRKKHNHLMATDWKYYIQEAIKTGLESPTPYKVIPYKNGIGIKKIEFIK